MNGGRQIIPVLSGLAIANELCHGVDVVQKGSNLDRVDFELDTSVGSINSDRIEALKNLGHDVVVEIFEANWSVRAVIVAGHLSIDEEGDLSGICAGDQVDAIARSISRADLGGLIRECADFRARVSISLKNNAIETRCHFVGSLEYLMQELGGRTWHTFARGMLRNAAVLVVRDAGDLVLELPALRIQGDTDDLDLDHSSVAIPGILGAGKVALPSPLQLAPAVPNENSALTRRLSDLINGVARSLVYYWLADSVTVGADRVSITFSGSRIVTISNLVPVPCSDIEAELALFSWAISGSDPAKSEAIQQAASMALSDDGSLAGAAVPIYRTAKSLYEISRRGAVAEALATRRAARDSAISTAHDCAKSAREVVVKSVERTVIQIAAAAGLIVANAKDLLSGPIAGSLLFVLTGIILLSWLISFRIELSSASGTIAALDVDLQEYRDSLSSEDIEAIRNMEVVRQSKERISSARRLVIYLSVFASVAFAGFGIYFAAGGRLGHVAVTQGPAGSQLPQPTSTQILPTTSGPGKGRQGPVEGNTPTAGCPVDGSGSQCSGSK